MPQTLGIFTSFTELAADERQLVKLAWQGAEDATTYGLCFKSNFPVGCAILAANKAGLTQFIVGSNVENESFPAVICAERNAITTCGAQGFTKLLKVAVVCSKKPGGSPCGLCRQVLLQFGSDAVFLAIMDRANNVRRASVSDLLPAARAKAVDYQKLDDILQGHIERLNELKKRSHVPYSNTPRAALFFATNKDGARGIFEGVTDENASYGGTASAECVAMRSARTAGFDQDVELLVTVYDPAAPNPVDGESLQVLREFAANAPVNLVGDDWSVVSSSLDELLPDSFGPEGL